MAKKSKISLRLFLTIWKRFVPYIKSRKKKMSLTDSYKESKNSYKRKIR